MNLFYIMSDTCDVTLANALSLSTVTNTNKYYLISPTYLTITTLPSNLRKTNCECAYLVRRGYFRSRDKDGGHTTRSAMVKCTQISWLYVEPDLLPMEVLHCGNDGAADQKKDFLHQGFRKLSYYRHTDTQTDATETITMSFRKGRG